MTDFELFCETFKKYQDLLGLNGYRIYFKYEPIDAFASIRVNRSDMIATVRLNSRVSKAEKPFQDIKLNAKHEALHLLLYSLEDLALDRCATAEKIGEACEELVHKLEHFVEIE